MPRRKAARLSYFHPDAWDDVLRAALSRSGPTRKGDKRPAIEVANVRASRRANLRRRRDAAIARSAAARQAVTGRRWRAARSKVAIADRMLAAMMPGRWHSVRDLINGSGCTRDAVHAKLYQVLWRERLVTRAPNPQWDGRRACRLGETREFLQPRYLWRLTAEGETRRRFLVGVWLVN